MEKDPIKLGKFRKQLLVKNQKDWGTLQEAVDIAQELKFSEKKIMHLLEVKSKFIFKNDGHKTVAFSPSGSALPAGSISVYWKFSPEFAIYIHRLQTQESYRHQGIATALMLTTLVGIKKQIEKNGLPRDSLKFELSAESYGDHGLTQEQLIAFYQSFGFDCDSRKMSSPSETPMKLIIPLKSKEEALKEISCWKCAQEFVEYNFSNPDNDNGSLDFETAQLIVEQKKKEEFVCPYHE